MLVILATQRSGSTMICRDIASTGKVGDPREYLLKVLKEIKLREKQFLDLDELLNFIKQASQINTLKSIKIMANQIQKIEEMLTRFSAVNEKYVKYECFYTYLVKSAFFVRVIRKDNVAQAVSRLMARNTKVYHVFGDNDPLSKLGHSASGEGYVRKEVGIYNRKDIEREISKIGREESIIDDFLSNLKISPINIIYEDAVESTEYIKDIGELYGICDLSAKIRTMNKVGGELSLEWIERFKQGN